MTRSSKRIVIIIFLAALAIQSCGAVEPERASPAPDTEDARHAEKTTGLLGSIPTLCAEDIAVYQGYVYVADGPDGLLIVNAKDPYKPTLVSTISTAYAFRLYVHKDHLYLCDGPGGIRVYSLANPTDLALTYSLLTKWASGIAFNDGFMYLADYYDGVKIFQVTDPAQPVPLGTNLPCRARDLCVDGTTLDLSDATFGLATYTLVSPAQPLWTYIDASRYANFEDVVIYDGYSLVARNDESTNIAIFNTSDPMHVTLADELHPARFINGLTRFGKVLFAACGEDGVLAFDLTDMSDIRLLWVVNTPGLALHAKPAGNILYVADMSSLSIYDIAGMGGDWS